MERQPNIHLYNWSAIDAVNLGKSRCPTTRHVIGNTQEGSGFCLSSEIRVFDPKTQRALAKNGTVYKLVGDAAPDGLVTEKCHCWTDEQLLHTINSTRMFVHAVATAKPTVVYTIALATARDAPPAEIGRLSVTRDGSACDVVFEGQAWSNEVRTMRLSDSIRVDEPICSLLVRLLKQVEENDRVSPTPHTDYFKLSVHSGPTAHYALEIESLQTVPFGCGDRQIFEYVNMRGRKVSVVIPCKAVAPLDFIVATFPEMAASLLRAID